MKQVERLVQADENLTDVFYDHWVLDIYQARPAVRKDVSLFEISRMVQEGW